MLNDASATILPAKDAIQVSCSPFNLLLVEDNELDVQIFKRALRKAGLSYPLTVAHDGLEALSILRGEDGAASFSRPGIVLLDLNMPRMDGHEFLDVMRADPALTDLVVFVLTTSDALKDKNLAYKQHVAGYVLKSVSGLSVMSTIHMLHQFAQVVRLPN